MLRPCLIFEKFKGKVACGLLLSPIMRQSKRSDAFRLEKDVVPRLSLTNGQKFYFVFLLDLDIESFKHVK